MQGAYERADPAPWTRMLVCEDACISTGSKRAMRTAAISSAQSAPTLIMSVTQRLSGSDPTRLA